MKEKLDIKEFALTLGEAGFDKKGTDFRFRSFIFYC